jgi:hypothetical protein
MASRKKSSKASDKYYYIPDDVDWRAFGEVVFDVVHDGVRRIGKTITHDEFLRLPDQIGGRAGILPWFPAYVRNASGERQHHYMVRLGVTNHMYLSDFGGGFGPEDSPYVGLVEEIKGEIPQWKRLVIQKLNDECLYLMMEQEQVGPRSLGAHGKKRKPPIPLQVLILVPLSPTEMAPFPFQATSEIRAIMDRTVEQFHDIVEHRPSIASDGIRMYALFYKMAPDLMEVYYHSEEEPESEYLNAMLTDDNVHVLLGDDETTLPFQMIVREDTQFSSDEEDAWKERKKYGRRMMAWRPSKKKVVASVASNARVDVLHVASPSPSSSSRSSSRPSSSRPFPASFSSTRKKNRPPFIKKK